MLKRLAVMTLIWSYRLKLHYQFSPERIKLCMDKFHKIYGGKIWYRVSLEQKVLDRDLEKSEKIQDKSHPSRMSNIIWNKIITPGFPPCSIVISTPSTVLFRIFGFFFYQIRNLFSDHRRQAFRPAAEGIQNRMICRT